MSVRAKPPLHHISTGDGHSVASSVASLTPTHKATKKSTVRSTRATSNLSERSFGGITSSAMGAEKEAKAEAAAVASEVKDSGGTSLSKTVRDLQKEADQQLELELETQQTLEHFLLQMVGLKNAFAMLSDVVMHEVDAARSEARRRVDAAEARVEVDRQSIDALTHHYGELTERVKKTEFNQEAILSELKALRAQGDQTSSWLTAVAEQLSVVKDSVSDLRNESVSYNAATTKEVAELKRHWDDQSTKIVTRINECGAEVSKQRADLTLTTEQRMDDLELLEKALSTLQAQQIRLRSNVDEAIIPLQTEVGSLRSKTDQLDASSSAVKMDMVEVRNEMEGIERDANMRFDNVGRVFKVFADHINVSVPDVGKSHS